jgi:hypothetical protein
VTSFGKNTGPTNIKKHFWKVHIEDWIQGCQDKGAPITGEAALCAVRMHRNLPEPTDLEADRTKFSKDAFADALTELVVGDDLVCKGNYIDNYKTHTVY